MAKVKISLLKKELDETKSALKRALADYANLEKRVASERELMDKLILAKLVSKFLPVLDNLNQAWQHTKDDGVIMVVNQFKQILESLGVKEIGAVGEKFDPKLHEAVEVVKGKDDNKIVTVISSGFIIDGQTIRPAMVKVEKSEVDLKAAQKAEKGKEFGDYA